MVHRIGQRLGNYQLTHFLGTGAFADVYLGEHVYLKTQAAIKVLHTRLMAQDLEAFLAEARTIAHLVHPHIVRVLEFGVEEREGIPYLVMDYAPNGTLRHRLPGGEPLPLHRMLPSVKQVAAALQYAHEAKVIHRDVKPENMLVSRTNTILLSDFGIATIAQSSTYQQTGGIAGTLAYMAPEQIQGKPRPASDQYALAVTVYEWLTGTRPFRGSISEVTAQQMFNPPPPLRERIPALSPAVEHVVLMALAKDPTQRFPSVQAFANALEQASLHTARSLSPFIPPGPPPAQVAPTLGAWPAAPTTASFWTPGPTTSPVAPYSPTWNPGPSYGMPQPPPAPRPGISRRALLVAGLAGAALVVGGGTVLALSQQTPGPGLTQTGSPTPAAPQTLPVTPPATPTAPPTQISPGAHISNVQIGKGDNEGNITNPTHNFAVSDDIVLNFTADAPDSTAVMTLKLVRGSQSQVLSPPLNLDQGQHDYYYIFTVNSAGSFTAELQYNGTTEAAVSFTVL